MFVGRDAALMLSLANLKIVHKGMVLIAVPLLLCTLCVGMLVLLSYTEASYNKQFHQERVIHTTFTQLERTVTRAVRTGTAFLYVRHVDLLDDYDSDKEESNHLISQVQTLTVGKDRSHTTMVEQLAASRRELFTVMDDAIAGKAVRRNPTLPQESFQQYQKQFKELIDAYNIKHPYDANARERAMQSITFVKQLILLTALANFALAIFAALKFGRSVTQRLNRLMENSMKLAAGEPLHPLLQGSDEVAQLDRVFHEMSRTITTAAKRERAIVDNAVDVICSLNKKLEFTAVSPSVESAWQFSKQEMIGRMITDLIEPSEADKAVSAFSEARNSKESKFDICMVTKSGASSFVSWSVHWSADEQTYFCVGHDITDRKRAEELLRESESRIRLIIESMPVGLLIIDSSGYIEMTNIQADHMFGYRYEDLLGEHLSMLFASEFGKSPEELMHVVTKYMGRISDVDARRKDGSVLPVQVSLTEFTLHGAKKILAAMLDVSERHAVEQLKKHLIATVSHDLRTPLTMIQNTLMILSSQTVGNLDERGHSLVESAETEAERLIEMINSLLDIEKMQSGRLQMELQPVSLDSVISRSVTVVSHAAEKGRVELEAEPSGCEVMADGAKLVQVMVNLLANAIKFSPKESKVTVRCEEDQGWLQINVSDQGRGIPAAHTGLIFESFYQVEESDRVEKGGTGLGLAICKTIVEAHGGLIGVKSEDGHGSTFWFKIPTGE